MRNKRGTRDNLMPPILKEVQKGLPEFVASHLLIIVCDKNNCTSH